MSQTIKYVAMFTVSGMPSEKAHYRCAFDLIVFPNMTAVEIMSEIDQRCCAFVKEKTGQWPERNLLFYTCISVIGSFPNT